MLAELERLGTLTAVARAMDYSPSAISQQLALLEREAGTPLMERVGRGVRLTDPARILAAGAREAADVLERAQSEVARTTGRVEGTLRVASFQTVTLALLPAVLVALGQEQPALRVELAQREPAEAVDGVLAGTFDVVLGEEYPGGIIPLRPRMDRAPLGTDELRLAVPEVGPWSGATTIEDLHDAPWAVEPEQTEPGRWAYALCRTAGFEPRVLFEGEDLTTHAHLVRSGLAVALLPDLLGAGRMPGIRSVRLPGAPERTLFTLTRAARAMHPAVLAFRSALATAFAQQQVIATSSTT
ncbi:LysR family transcriptional regulator [Arenivirga flava]|uniref:LysR family transcriptional regulator n=1 Tax=Arenivirga flava TaxID=1930060 RepID=UPI0024E0900B|nr:LysR family transcriptional regulator [Arenivirga flava]